MKTPRMAGESHELQSWECQSRISDVTVEQTLLGRIFGYGDVVPVSISGFGIIGNERYAAERRLDQLDSVGKPYQVAQFIMREIDTSRTLPPGN